MTANYTCLFATAMILVFALMTMVVDAAPAVDSKMLPKRDSTVTFSDYTITYYDKSPDINSGLSLKATTASTMQVVLCTDSPLYSGLCMQIALLTDGCVDISPNSPWEDTISSIGINTQDTLCKIYVDHTCVGSDATYLNMGDTSRDTVKMKDWNDKISSIACYWDPRGVTGEWDQ